MFAFFDRFTHTTPHRPRPFPVGTISPRTFSFAAFWRTNLLLDPEFHGSSHPFTSHCHHWLFNDDCNETICSLQQCRSCLSRSRTQKGSMGTLAQVALFRRRFSVFANLGIITDGSAFFMDPPPRYGFPSYPALMTFQISLSLSLLYFCFSTGTI